jgi:protein-S-isoprenylcysteine O-methyltransferase Ste14
MTLGGFDRGAWIDMMRETADDILMGIVGAAFFVNMALLSGLVEDVTPVIEELTIVGWIVLGVGALFVIMSVLTLRKKGIASISDSGIYGIIRHPMYLGGILMFVSHIMFGQTWMIVVSTTTGVCCSYILTLWEEDRLIKRFGDDYRHYMQRVPRMNLLSGIVRAMWRETGQ